MNAEYSVQLLLDPIELHRLGSHHLHLAQNESIPGEHGEDNESKAQEQTTADTKVAKVTSLLCDMIDRGPETFYKLPLHGFYLSTRRSPDESVLFVFDSCKGGPVRSPVILIKSFQSAAADSGAVFSRIKTE